MSEKLTPKQEAFAAGVAQGLTQAEAYRRAYPSSTQWKDETVWREACKQANYPKVLTRIKELKDSLAQKELWTREQSVHILAKIALDEESKHLERIKAVTELNKMHGFEAPQKVEHSGDLSIISILREIDANAHR